MHNAIEAFEQDFARWGLHLPPEDVAARRSGQLREAGWTVFYDFGQDVRGEFLDYYAGLRDATDETVNDDWHVRLYESGERVTLPTVLEAYMYSREPTREELDRARRKYAERRAGEPGTAPGVVPVVGAPPPPAAAPVATPALPKAAHLSAHPAPTTAEQAAAPMLDIGLDVALDLDLERASDGSGENAPASWLLTPPTVPAIYAAPEPPPNPRPAPPRAASPTIEPAAINESLIDMALDSPIDMSAELESELLDHQPSQEASEEEGLRAMIEDGLRPMRSPPEPVSDSAAPLSLVTSSGQGGVAAAAKVPEVAQSPGEEADDGVDIYYPQTESAPVSVSPTSSPPPAVEPSNPPATPVAPRRPDRSVAVAAPNVAPRPGPSAAPPTSAAASAASAASAPQTVATAPLRPTAPRAGAPLPSAMPKGRVGVGELTTDEESAPSAERPSLDGYFASVEDRTWLQRPVGSALQQPVSAAARPSGAFTADVPGVPREGITQADADLLRPWWRRQENRVGMAIVGAAAVLCIVVVLTIIVHRPSRSGASPAKSGTSTAATVTSTDSNAVDDSSSPAADTRTPTAEPARDTAPTVRHTFNAPAPPSDQTATTGDESVAHPVGPQSVAPILPSRERTGRPTRPAPPATAPR